jgi:uncharacterized membrane protein YfcA
MIGLEPFTQEIIWMALPAILLAALVHGTFGIGFPMIATPLLALYTDVLTAVSITLLPTMSVNLAMIARGNKEQFRNTYKHLRILPFIITGTVIGTFLLLWLDPRPFFLVLAAAILLYLKQDKLEKIDFGWVQQRTNLAYVIFGLSAGLMAGTVNVMVPVLIILFLELRLAAAPMILLFNISFFTGKLTQSLILSQQSLNDIELILPASLWLIPVALVALYLGTRLRTFINEDRYLKVLRGVLWAMAGILVARFIVAYL